MVRCSIFSFLLFLLFGFSFVSANCVIQGAVLDESGVGIVGANVSAYCTDDATWYNVNTVITGVFVFSIAPGMNSCSSACGSFTLNASNASTVFLSGSYPGNPVSADPETDGSDDWANFAGTVGDFNITVVSSPHPDYYNSAMVNDSYGSEEVSIYWNMSDDGAVDGTIGGNFSYNSSNDSTVTTGGVFTTGGTKAFSNFSSMSVWAFLVSWGKYYISWFYEY